MSVLGAVLRREWWVNTRAYRISFFGATFMGAIFAMAVSYFLYHVAFAGEVTAEFTALAATDEGTTRGRRPARASRQTRSITSSRFAARTHM